LQQLKLADLQQLDSHFAEDFYRFVTLENVLAIHDVPGGTAPARVNEAIAAARRRLSSVHEEAHAHA
jgi:argininosuccinate lyase